MSKQKDNMTAERWDIIKSMRNPLRHNSRGQGVLKFLPHLARFYPFLMLRGL